VFTKQADAIRYVREKLAMLGHGKIDRTHSEFEFFEELLKRHPKHGDKIVSSFGIQPNAFGQPELYFRTATERHVFSYSHAIRGKSYKNDLHAAMRAAIVLQLNGAKREEHCELCSKALCAPEHVDHVIPFRKLRDEFLEQWKGEIPTEFEKGKRRGGVIDFLRNDILFKIAWQTYHKDHAVLRVVHASCNLSRGGRDDHQVRLSVCKAHPSGLDELKDTARASHKA
jgi:hypothetical protein